MFDGMAEFMCGNRLGVGIHTAPGVGGQGDGLGVRPVAIGIARELWGYATAKIRNSADGVSQPFASGVGGRN
ncbi:MAG: hypothetical protein ACJAZO_004559 [Myxococcota bacterium]|jgi:hypothetical protein